MRLTHYNRLIGLTLVVTAAACVEPYPAPDIADELNILVVDGYINASDGIATVRLTHTMKLNEEGGSTVEEGATVNIRTESGGLFTLIEQDSGRYTAEGLSIDANSKYQLNIKTRFGAEYISDYVTIKDTPPIDSVTWHPDGDGVSIKVNTHDPTAQSRYYRWEFVETWEYHAPYVSLFRVHNKEAVYREPDEFMFICYSTVPSTNILLTSTVQLDEDVVHDFPLTYIPRVSSRLSVKYSMMVQQRVVDRDEYEFWQDLKRVTENVGGLFDSQPYEIVGNVHNANDPSSPVLGYFGGGFVSKERIYVDYYELPLELRKRPYHGCVQDTICLVRTPDTTYGCLTDIPGLPENTALVNALYDGPTLYGYTTSRPSCTDCRLQGGVLTKPDFWP